MPPLTDPLDWFIVTPTSTTRFTTPSGTGTSRSRLRVPDPSAPQRMNHSQEHTLPTVPRQQPVQQPVTPLNDLARHQDDRVHERLELHPQQSSLLRAMNFLVTRVLRNRQREPCLQVPCQG